MSREPRDPRWASDMEALIEHDVLFEQQPPRFEIRTIECRSSLCAAEVDSNFTANGIYGPYPGGIAPGHDALDAALRTNFLTFASEHDSTGDRIVVTVITFTRR